MDMAPRIWVAPEGAFQEIRFSTPIYLNIIFQQPWIPEEMPIVILKDGQLQNNPIMIFVHFILDGAV